MPVSRNGGVITGPAGKTPVGQPSPAGTYRSDLVSFNVPFDRDKFTRLIIAHGYDVTWEKAAWCPFIRGPDPKAHDINCTACHNGFVYFDAKETRMHLASLSISQQFYAYGRFDTGKVMATALPEFKVSFWDRITLCNSRTRAQELVLRQANTLRDRFKYQPLCVIYLQWVNSASELATATEHVDFEIDEDTGELVWETSNRPDANQFYSVVYFHRPIFIVLDCVHQIRDEQVPKLNDKIDKSWEFPVQVVAQLDAFVRDEGKGPDDEGIREDPFPAQRKNPWPGT